MAAQARLRRGAADGVFTEPNTGSDLASLRTRAQRDGDVYKVSGNKTWITHPVRADLMTLLVRTDPKSRAIAVFRCCSRKSRAHRCGAVSGARHVRHRDRGARLSRHEGIRDRLRRFRVKAEGLLGGVEGQGFKQLMQTFESARIQTAARAVGVAQAAMDQAITYANDRVQFGQKLIEFPRVADKIAMMAAEIMIARQISYYAAREKDKGRRCDLEAGMAKLLAARVAWAAADNALQDPWRQRLCAGIQDFAHPVRCAHPVDLRGRGRNPGPGDRAAPARRAQLSRRGAEGGRPAPPVAIDRLIRQCKPVAGYTASVSTWASISVVEGAPSPPMSPTWQRLLERSFAGHEAQSEAEVARFQEIKHSGLSAHRRSTVGFDSAADAWIIEARKPQTPRKTLTLS